MNHKVKDKKRFEAYGDGKHLVYMGIEYDTLPSRGRHESIPVAYRLESVMDHDYEIAFL